MALSKQELNVNLSEKASDIHRNADKIQRIQWISKNVNGGWQNPATVEGWKATRHLFAPQVERNRQQLQLH